jgi:hypothetical protein
MPSNAARLSDFGSGIGTFGAVLQVDNTNQRIGIGTTNPQSTLQVGVAITMDGAAGVITATTFSGNATSATSATSATTATNAEGLTGTPNITVGNITASSGDLAIRNVTGVAATFTGVLTYEDVNNVDSVGVITARSGIEFGAAGVGGTITAAGAAEFAGIVTASEFHGDASNLTNLPASGDSNDITASLFI